MEPISTRDRNGAPAQINIEDISKSYDGDTLSREWLIAFDTNNNDSFDDEAYKPLSEYTYTDFSFGATKKIKLEKPDLGLVDVRLKVTDVWTEGTLPEFIVPSDIKSSFYTNKITNVINIAPVVSLELKDQKIP